MRCGSSGGFESHADGVDGGFTGARRREDLGLVNTSRSDILRVALDNEKSRITSAAVCRTTELVRAEPDADARWHVNEDWQ